MKEVNTQSLWTFELGTHEGLSIPIWIIVAIQQRDRQDSQNLNNDTFYTSPVNGAQCHFTTKKYPDSATLLSYDDDNYSQAYGENKKAFKALTKDDILQLYISHSDFRSSNNGNDVGYNLYVCFRYKISEKIRNCSSHKNRI